MDGIPHKLKQLNGNVYYKVVTEDCVAHPHVTDVKAYEFPNGDFGVKLKNPYGDDYMLNLQKTDIKRVNQGKFSLDGATHVYHSELPVEAAREPTKVPS